MHCINIHVFSRKKLLFKPTKYNNDQPSQVIFASYVMTHHYEVLQGSGSCPMHFLSLSAINIIPLHIPNMQKSIREIVKIQSQCAETWFIVFLWQIQSTLVISKLNEPSGTLRDIRTSTHQILRIAENTNRTIKFHK